MLHSAACVPRNLYSQRSRFSRVIVVGAGLLLTAFAGLGAQEGETKSATPSRLVDPIDEHVLVTLKGNVRPDLATAPDLGVVEDSKPLHLFLLLQRTTAQQADMDNLILRQQQPEYHKWLTPKQFGTRFGASPADIAKVSAWLESHGFQVRSVSNNASMIDFAATAGQVREAFHTELHYFNIGGGKYPANIQDPQIPAALAPLVAGIKGLVKIPPHMDHTSIHQASYDPQTHRWHTVGTDNKSGANPAFYDPQNDNFDVTPQDLYTIYNINPQFTAGNLAASATVAVIEESDMDFGTVDETGLVTGGGDVNKFRSLFGVPGTLNMHVFHGYGTVACNAPGIDPNPKRTDEDVEASLDAEWINATAPSANEIFMSCDQDPDQGIWTSMAALIDNNLPDVMSLSYAASELIFTAGDYTFQDTLYAQAIMQGQSFFVSAGDSGSDVADQNTSGTAISGINVNAYGSSLLTVVGGTDFSDVFDQGEGGPMQSTYWGSTNSIYYGDALGYIPETAWNASCASSILAEYKGFSGSGASFCASQGTGADGTVVGGSGGISTHYGVPFWQSGISGYSDAKRAQPDIAGFASNGGAWGHALIFCDSIPTPDHYGTVACNSYYTFGESGGTSFVAPYLAGVAGLLVNYTGARQGSLNPTLYALAKEQYTNPATATACYSNGQTANIGITTGLPAASCIFNDVTTSNNDVPCAAGTTNCYVNIREAYGLLSTTGESSLTVAYPSQPGFDQVTGLGTLNVNNLITKWNTAFTSSTAVSANPTSISSGQSTRLKATVTAGTPTGYLGTPPAVTGTATFKAGTKVVGNCTLSGGICSTSVSASSLQAGANSVTATFAGSGTYPSSTSSITTVTVTGGSTGTGAVLTSPTPGSVFTGLSETFGWSAVSGATAYNVVVGSTGVGSNNLGSSGVITATSATFGGLPTNGETIYVQLSTEFGSTWIRNNYTFTSVTQSALTSPTPGHTLTGATSMFGWTAVPGVTGYELFLGSTGAGSSNLYSSGVTTSTSVTSGALPVNGGTIYARLFTDFNGTFVHTDYTYTAATLTGSSLTTPAPSSVLTGPNLTFTWTAATGATSYELSMGSTGAGSSNLFITGWRTATSWFVTTIPTNGETLYVRLSTNYSGTIVHTDYTYTATALAAITSPAPGGPLPGPTATFTWTPATGATGYVIVLGTTGVGSSNLGSSGKVTGTSAVFGALPVNGQTIYARMTTFYNTYLQHRDFTYVAATQSALTTPAPGSTFTSSTPMFTWSSSPGATNYELVLGSTGVGSGNLWASGYTTATSATSTALPVNGETIYARLYTNFGGNYVHADYTYHAVTLSAATLTSPTPGSTLTGSNVTFTWGAATQATQYKLVIGSTGVGSSNLANTGWRTATSWPITGLPKNGETLYVRLTTSFSGTLVIHDYTYTAAGS